MKDEDKACADLGEIHVIMLPDYGAFVSFQKVSGRYMTLGDDTKVPILGEETAKFSLNGKIILVRGALYVP